LSLCLIQVSRSRSSLGINTAAPGLRAHGQLFVSTEKAEIEARARGPQQKIANLAIELISLKANHASTLWGNGGKMIYFVYIHQYSQK